MPLSEELFDACRKGDEAAVERLLAADPALRDERDAQGLSPVLVALYHGHRGIADQLAGDGEHLDLASASAAGRGHRVLRILVADRTLVHQHSQDGWTPLHLAAFFGSPEVAEILLAHGADVHARSTNAMANTPLHAAAAGRQANVATVLMAHGADLKATQRGGLTALHSAAANGDFDLVKLLVAHGAVVEARDDEGRRPAELADARGHAEVAEYLRAHTA